MMRVLMLAFTLVLGISLNASSGDYLNASAVGSLRAGRSAAFMPLAMAEGSPSAGILFFYEREVSGPDNKWNWTATGNVGGAGLPPGHYRMQFVQFGGLPRLGVRTSYAVNENQSEVGSFDVAPGEAVYLGSLSFAPDGPNLSVTVEDKFDEVRAHLPAAVANHLVKRLINVPPHYRFQHQEIQ